MDAPPELVAQLLPVELKQYPTPEWSVVDVAQDVQRLDDAPEFGQGLGQRRRAVFDLQHAHEFEELSGHFWGFLQTRPYMWARAGLAVTLWRLGDQQAAIDHYRAMLILNPNDNQGIRYLLATALLARDDIAGLKVLLNQYEEDGSAAWVYTLALIAYREQDPHGSAIVQEAWDSNPHVPAMLAGLKRLTPSRDGYISMGGEDEATAYVEENGAAWRAVPGAVEWLVERTAALKPRHYGRKS